MNPELVTSISGVVVGLINLALILGMYMHLSNRLDIRIDGLTRQFNERFSGIEKRFDDLRDSVNARIDLLLGKIHELEMKIK